MKVGLSSFLLTVPVWTAWVWFRGNETTGASHTFAVTAVFLLICAVIVGFFGVGFALVERGLSVRERLATAVLCLPALGTGGFLLLVLSSIPPT